MGRPKKNYSLLCEYCGKEFMADAKHAKRGWRRFCSRSCSGKSSTPAGSQTGPLSSSWKGGEFVSRLGYGMSLIPGSGSYTTKQRVCIERSLGRRLRPDEIVHHLDGNKLNNSLSNLTVYSRAEHMNIHRLNLKKKGDGE